MALRVQTVATAWTALRAKTVLLVQRDKPEPLEATEPMEPMGSMELLALTVPLEQPEQLEQPEPKD